MLGRPTAGAIRSIHQTKKNPQSKHNFILNIIFYIVSYNEIVRLSENLEPKLGPERFQKVSISLMYLMTQGI
jgi:hypothetical protein